MKINGTGPVFGLDIDGSLGDYHAHFLRFAEGWVGKTMPDPQEINPGVPLFKFMGVSKVTYRRIKTAYRQGGLKRSLPAYLGASELSYNLRHAGKAEVWICTSRPYLAHGPIDPDTRHWLRRNRIQYDNIVWGENKYRDLNRLAGSRVAGVLEDLPPMADQALDQGMSVILKDQPYNRWYDPEGMATIRVPDLIQGWEWAETLIDNWKARQA